MSVIQEQLNLQEESNVVRTMSTALPALIRAMRPEEAAAVCNCVYRCYGYSYPNRDMYDPARVLALNQEQKIVSYVAVDYCGGVIGHAALELDSANPTVGEMGNAFVLPEHRGSGLLNEFADVLVNAAKNRGLAGAFVGSVCSHYYSQKAAHKMGFSDTALLLNRLPHMQFRRLHSIVKRRENILHSFRIFAVDKPLSLYVPPRHRNMVEQIYQHLGLKVSWQSAPDRLTTPKVLIRVNADPYGAVHIFIRQNPGGSKTGLAEVKPNDQTEVTYLYLNLAEPETPLLCGIYEYCGYFFAGILPGAGDCNWLVLQKPRDKCDYTKLEVASALGQALTDYVKSQEQR